MYYSVLLLLCFLFGRILLLCSRYFIEPSLFGEILISDWDRFIPFHIVADIGVFAFICAIFTIIRAPKIAAFVLAFYMFSMGADDESVRWIGSRFSLQFISVYMFNTGTDFSLIYKIFMEDALHFSLTIGIIIATEVTYLFLIRKKKQIEKKHRNILLCIFIIFAILGLTSGQWLNPSERRWSRVQPVGVHWVSEFFESTTSKPENYEKGVELLGGNSNQKYPFWHQANDSVSYSNFRSRSPEQKPDIFIFTIESMRGQYSDIRDSSTCANLPNLCEFSKQAMFFPEAHSVGFPTVEGIVGIQMGIYSHPRKYTIRNRKYMKTESLPEILTKSGYYNAIFTAAEPRFDNLLSHFNDWFDYVEYDDSNNEDVLLANRVSQWLAKFSEDKPLYLNYMGISTHTPFTLPEHSGYSTPENLQERYKLALHYADSAIGILLKAVEMRDRESVIVILGDHGLPEISSKAANNISNAYTHIPIFISGNSVPKNRIDSRIVSQSSIAPTILDILNLDVSNHFVNKSLLSNSKLPVFTFKDENWSVYNVKADSASAKNAMESWSYILDKDLLMP